MKPALKSALKTATSFAVGYFLTYWLISPENFKNNSQTVFYIGVILLIAAFVFDFFVFLFAHRNC